MADEPKRSSRTSSTGATRKGRAKSTFAAASDGVQTAAETPAAAAPAAPTPTSASEPPAPTPPAAEPRAPAAAYTAPQAPAAEASGGGVALAGLVAGVVGIVLALTYPQWTPIVYGSSGSSNRVTADQVRTEMKGEIDALKATVASMTDKQLALEQAIRTAKLPGILMVAEDLRAALGESEPYAGTLNLFRSLTGDDAEAASIVAVVEGRAEVGIPGTAAVRDGFDEVAHAVLMAEQRPQATGDLAAQVSDTVASLAAATMRLRWRLDGAPSGDGVPAVVARAEEAVVNGDLQLAIDTLGMLPAERLALARSWIDMVQTRMQAEAVREELDSYIISLAARIQ